MERYLYFSLTPEALIVSMLPPNAFGPYLAVGTQKRTRGQAMFFQVDMDKVTDILPWAYIERRCVPKEDGTPKNSVYLSIYRVLETIPLEALMSFYLVTDDGRVLELKQDTYHPDKQEKLHLYQELAPVTPRIVSSKAPKDFMHYMTSGEEQVQVPKLAFVELRLGNLALDAEHGDLYDLPYENVEHLRDCMITLRNEPDKVKKTVIRFYNRDLLYRTIKNGFFIGDKDQTLYYPFPSLRELEEKYYKWWRSAISTGF